MSYSRRPSPPLNPFVVLSDIALTIILILLFYFTALFMVTHKKQQDEIMRLHNLVGQAGDVIQTQKGQIADLGVEVFKLTHNQAERTQTIADMQKVVERNVTDNSSLRAYHEHVDISYEGDTQVFSFQTNGLFSTQGADLDPRSLAYLHTFADALGNVLQQQAQHYDHYPEIQVQGHTDKAPWDNWTLSMQRALAVVKVFSNSQMHSEYLSAAGYSCHRPRIDPRSSADQAPNRRIEVRLVYNTRPFSNARFKPELPNNCNCDR